MSAPFPNFTYDYAPHNRSKFSGADATGDSVSVEDKQWGESRKTKLFDPPQRIQAGRIGNSKDHFRDWLVSAWSTKPSVIRWAEAIQEAQRARLHAETPRRFDTLAHISRALQESQQILELKDDWDGEGSLGYTKAVWNRACKFVTHNATEALNRHATVIQAPKILPGPDGSIDVHWKTAARELLVNIPRLPDQPAEFYGDDYGSLQIKGRLNPENPPSALLLWLPVQD